MGEHAGNKHGRQKHNSRLAQKGGAAAHGAKLYQSPQGQPQVKHIRNNVDQNTNPQHIQQVPQPVRGAGGADEGLNNKHTVPKIQNLAEENMLPWRQISLAGTVDIYTLFFYKIQYSYLSLKY